MYRVIEFLKSHSRSCRENNYIYVPIPDTRTPKEFAIRLLTGALLLRIQCTHCTRGAAITRHLRRSLRSASWREHYF